MVAFAFGLGPSCLSLMRLGTTKGTIHIDHLPSSSSGSFDVEQSYLADGVPVDC